MYTRPSLHGPSNLQPGEWQAWCDGCGWRAPKNSACSNVCQECGRRDLRITEESHPPEFTPIRGIRWWFLLALGVYVLGIVAIARHLSHR